MGGRKTYQRTRSPENFLDASKRASGLLCRGFLYRKNRALTPEGGWKTYRTRGGPKPPFGKGVFREVFHPLLFSTLPMASSECCKTVQLHEDICATLELFYIQLTILVFYLQFEPFCLQL